MRHYIPAAAITPDENCGDGNSSKFIPSAGSVEHIVLPPDSKSAGLLMVPVPPSWNGTLSVRLMCHSALAESGSVRLFVAARSVKSVEQFAAPENVTPVSQVVTVPGALDTEYFSALINVVGFDKNGADEGDVLTIWAGRDVDEFEGSVKLLGVEVLLPCA